MKKIHPALITALLLCTLTSITGAQETKEQRDKRMAWWRKARFGMFIHWGLYAIPAGVWKGKKVKGIGEWIMYHGRIPVHEYEPLAKKFNPVKFDAGAWGHEPEIRPIEDPKSRGRYRLSTAVKPRELGVCPGFPLIESTGGVYPYRG